MKTKHWLLGLAMMALFALSVAAQDANPLESYWTSKLLPFIQWGGTVAGIVTIIWGAVLLGKGNPEDAEKGKKMIFGSIIGVALVWLAPALVNWLKP